MGVDRPTLTVKNLVLLRRSLIRRHRVLFNWCNFSNIQMSLCQSNSLLINIGKDKKRYFRIGNIKGCLEKLLPLPMSLLCSKSYPLNIKHMPVVKF